MKITKRWVHFNQTDLEMVKGLKDDDEKIGEEKKKP
jgi:hypothetical protein